MSPYSNYHCKETAPVSSRRSQNLFWCLGSVAKPVSRLSQNTQKRLRIHFKVVAGFVPFPRRAGKARTWRQRGKIRRSAQTYPGNAELQLGNLHGLNHLAIALDDWDRTMTEAADKQKTVDNVEVDISILAFNSPQKLTFPIWKSKRFFIYHCPRMQLYAGFVSTRKSCTPLKIQKFDIDHEGLTNFCFPIRGPIRSRQKLH